MALESFFPSRLKRYAYTTDHIRQFMDYVGNPQNTPKVIHIAGTSGKTSTAYFVAALLQQAGKRVGLLTSPHITSITERVQIDMTPLSDREFCDELAIFLDEVATSGIVLTYAELLYAFAFWEFVRQQAEYIVVEVGLGGLQDATNVIDRPDKVCVITDIGLDHTSVLGDTLEEITQHKAGIIQLHNTVCCHEQPEPVMGVIRAACRQRQADLHIVRQHPILADLPHFQQRNFALALQATRVALQQDNSPKPTRKQILVASQILIPARMEKIRIGEHIVVLDGAHNQQKLRAFRQAMELSFAGQQIAVLAAFVHGRGRDTQELIEEIVPFAHHLIITTLPPTRSAHTSRPAKDILIAAQKAGIASTEVIVEPQRALEVLLARPEPVMAITGSLYLLEALRPLVLDSLTEAKQQSKTRQS